MRKNAAIIIGWINSGKTADCGETMKNQLLVKKLEDMGIHCRLIDFKNWKRHPWVFLKLLWCMVFHKDNPIIFSTSTVNVYPMMKLMKKLRWKQHSIHWVIGGAMGENTMKGFFSPSVIDYMDWTLVESDLMVKQLESVNVNHVLQVPNFKPIMYYPNITSRLDSLKHGRKLNFVFLSRIMQDKGCDYIFQSVQNLNTVGYQDRFDVSFYGKIDDVYKKEFLKKINSFTNVYYKGFLNLQEHAGIDELAGYDVMLFPTYWKGEGFAGVFIDSFICGVPMIASDWAHNRQFLKDMETAMVVPVHDVEALTNKMQDCIDGNVNLQMLSVNCQQYASYYDVNNVITNDLLKKIGLIK